MDPKTPSVYLAILQAELARHDQKESAKRRADLGALPTDTYGAIEDIVLLRAIDDLLNRVWHKEDAKGHYRKGRLHLSALAFELREKLRDQL